MISTTCDFCEVLNIGRILEEDHKAIAPSLAEKLIRYYCNNPDTENNYCPPQGDEGKMFLPFHARSE